MLAILQGEFFWGIIIGLILSVVGGWALAKFTVHMQTENAKKTVVYFCMDTIKNIQSIISDMDSTRDKAKAIHHDYLNLIDIEIQIYGRNREHLIHLSDDTRNLVRNYMNAIAIKKAEISKNLDLFYQINAMADRAQAEGRGPEAQRFRAEASVPLVAAQLAADKIVTASKDGNHIIQDLSRL
mgnify:CR=1 FL=1